MTKTLGPNVISVADAKKRLSDLLGRVAYGKETILIVRRGRPMARLVPPDESAPSRLAAVRGWLDDDDSFLQALDQIAAERVRHRPRSLPKRRRREKR